MVRSFVGAVALMAGIFLACSGAVTWLNDPDAKPVDSGVPDCPAEGHRDTFASGLTPAHGVTWGRVPGATAARP